jgi:putative protein-disulfide isomerase
MTAADLQFVYFADPMCSWCWGFSPVVDALRATHPELPLRVVMGGLRPGTTEPMTDEAKASTREHWQHVHEASGQPFDFAFFDRDGFVYDTDPAARAVVAARRSSWDAAIEYLKRAQAAFYAEGRDVTKEDVLVDLATELGHDAAIFRAELRSEDVKNETWADYAISQRAGVTGFPTLILGPGPDGAYLPVSRGYQPPERVAAVVDYYLQHLARAVSAG